MKTSRTSGWPTAILEITVLIIAVIFLKKAFDPFFWRFAGPVALALTMIGLAFYLKYRGQSWESLGVRRLPSRKDKLLLIPQIMLTFTAMAVVLSLINYAGEALGWGFMQEVPEGVDERWGDVTGNTPLFLVWVAISWVIGGFSEEVLFRGFMITRLTTLFGGG